MPSPADTYERHAAPLTDLFTGHVLDLAGVVAERVVVDVACGTALATRAAARCGARQVVGVDLLDWMTVRARVSCTEAGLGNVAIARMDAARLGLRDSVADVTLCQFGLMLMGEGDAAARELRRVTRPGGTVVGAVWGVPERAPAFACFLDAAGEVLSGAGFAAGHAVFRLGGAGVLADLLAGAGLYVGEERRVTEVDVRVSETAYWAWMSSTVGFRVGEGEAAYVTTADRLDATVQAAIRGRTLERAAPWRRSDGSLAFPMEAVIVRADVPSTAP